MQAKRKKPGPPPGVDGDRAVPGPRYRANSVSAPVGRDGFAQHRKEAANDASET